MKSHEIIIIGGGPGGSTLASFLGRAGLDVGIFEKEAFPRFKIGESLLPGSMKIFKENGFYEYLNSGKYIRKYGAWFIDYRYPQEVYFNFTDTNNPDEGMAFEVERCDFDKDLLEHSKRSGAVIYQPERVMDVSMDDSGGTVTTEKGKYRAKYIVDASGRIAFMGHRQKMRRSNTDLNNVAVFAHFTGVKRRAGKQEGDITVGLLEKNAWSWIIPFKGEKTSVGIVTSAASLDRTTILDNFIERSLSCSPLFENFLAKAQRKTEIMMISNYSHTCEQFIGERWIALGDAAMFLDPIFSSGVHVSVSSARFLFDVLCQAIKGNRLLTEKDLGPKYEATLRRGTKRFHSLIRLFYDTDFVQDMTRVLSLPHVRSAYTSVVAGDVWNEDNVAFKMGAL